MLTIAISAVGTGAAAEPASFTLTFEGFHVVDAQLPAGIRHEGRFTASAPFCTAGTGVDVGDVQIEPLSVLRLHRCDDGSGSFTALMKGVLREHGSSGPWQIVEGTGRYATLRGIGTYRGEILSGDPDQPATVVYRTRWEGVVAFDALPPTIGVTAKATKLKRPLRSYSIRLALRVADDVPGTRVTYSVDLRAGKNLLAYRTGATASGVAAITMRIRAPRGTRRIQIFVTASDAVGNESTATRSAKLR